MKEVHIVAETVYRWDSTSGLCVFPENDGSMRLVQEAPNYYHSDTVFILDKQDQRAIYQILRKKFEGE